MKMLAAIIATALLVGATTATAATLITSADIANNSIRGKDIRRGSITLSDVSPAAVRSLRGPRGPRGRQGPQGVPGVAGAKGTTDIIYVDGPVITIGPGGSAGTYANCPAGSLATGGGIGAATEAQLLPIDSYTISSGGFGVFAFNPDSTSRTLQARAACARR